ncbi:hypothetical protein GALL_97850 [mine drainage metagenome]|uniref:Transglycosylase SLT domain-containing protein n=1 Tax=mine drainage metagenome TaxID=410659 RepID=A0A1J5SHP1_9ZZZZ
MKEADVSTAVQTERQQAASRVARHVQQASRHTGISFGYLMAQAGKESGFHSNSQSRVSSAAGLYQFTRGTWLQLMKEHGAALGLSDLAEHIHCTHRGEYAVSDAVTRQHILDLRRDPRLSAMMAGEYAKDNKHWLERALGHPVNATDLYMAHFLGPGGAARILRARAEDPHQSAAALLPAAARKNPSVFYDHGHKPKSVAEFYARIDASIEKPMLQYARLDGGEPTISAPAEETAAAGGVGVAASKMLAEAGGTSAEITVHRGHHHYHHHHRVEAHQSGDPAWPFEQANWPPPYVPSMAYAAHGPATIEDNTDRVAYTDASLSADTISAPMPPAPAVAAAGSADQTGLNEILSYMRKGLFG